MIKDNAVVFVYKRKSDSATAVHSVSNPESLYASIVPKKIEKVNSGATPTGDGLNVLGRRAKIRKQTQTYWMKRSVERTLDSEVGLARHRRVCDQARRQTVRDVQAIYAACF